jgi:cytidylate kinase
MKLTPGDFVIAVDGTAASGKGTIASGLAAHYGLPHLDTGLLYRAVGAYASQTNPPFDETQATMFAERGVPETLDFAEYRTREAGQAASRVAAYPGVRAGLLDFQRNFAHRPGGAILDGRDIGTVIAPEAVAKLFVTAAPEVRAERRWKQLTAAGESSRLVDVLDDIKKRDARDSSRSNAPLAQAPDAHLLDTTEMSISQAFDEALRIVEQARRLWLGSKDRGRG